MSRLLASLRQLAGDQAGQTTIEWALLIAVVGLPAITVFGWLLAILAENYRMVTFLELLPFP
ncbi:MAG: hypothetical protein WBF17_04375 [Phycisphaerae bacterium]|jgi:Flp pilus assembly pilin Flp